MKLSEAIRKGVKKTKPIRGAYLFKSASGRIHACALGAALVAAKPSLLRRKHMPENDEAETMLRNTFPADMFSEYQKSLDPGVVRDTSIFLQVLDLNDSRGLGREEIADLLEARGY